MQKITREQLIAKATELLGRLDLGDESRGKGV